MIRLGLLVVSASGLGLLTGCCCCGLGSGPQEPVSIELPSHPPAEPEPVCCRTRVEDPNSSPPGKEVFMYSMHPRAACEGAGAVITILDDDAECLAYAKQDVCCEQGEQRTVRPFAACLEAGGLWTLPSACGL